jgi:hypothetical protein
VAHRKVQEGPCFRVQDEGFGVDALIFGVIGVTTRCSDFPWKVDVCSGDSEEIWYAGLYTYVYLHGDQLE